MNAMGISTTKGLSAILSQFIADVRLDEVPDHTVTHTKLLLLDTLGAALAGVETADGKAMIRAARHFGAEGGPSTVWGTPMRNTRACAALVNGALAHAQDLDDFGGCDHSGAVVIPAVLAASEGLVVSGARILEALIVGYDVALRVLEAAGGFRAHTARGWHTTGTCGSFGAAAGVAKVLNLSMEQTVSALGLAGTYTGGTWAFQVDNAMSKRYHVGRAAENGVVAGFLAREGFTGPAYILEAEWGGFLQTYAGGDAQPEKISEHLGKEFKITRSGVKPYACCRDIHSALDVIFELQRVYGLRADQVETMQLDCRPETLQMVGNSDPVTRQAAQMSLPYSAAVAWVTGRASLMEYEDAWRTDPSVRKFMSRITTRVGASLPPGSEPVVTVTTRDGRIYKNQVKFAKGAPENPLSREETVSKFRGLAARVLSSAAVELLADTVFSIESAGALSRIFTQLSEPARR